MDELSHLFNQLSPKSILLKPNQGNGGDALIASGTFRYLERIGIECDLIPSQKSYSFPKDSVVVYSGGGNLVSQYSACSEFLSAIQEPELLRALIILPHTIQGNEELLSILGENVHIFCREQYSFEYAKQMAAHAKVYLREDMAFELNPEDCLQSNASMRPIKLFIKQLLIKARNGRFDFRILNAFRKDVEKSDRSIPIDNIDVSMRINDCLMMDNQELVDRTTNDIFAFLNCFGTVNTNRLHIAIASALLKKKVNFYPNSYYKNLAMFEQSLSRFPNVRFISEG